MVKKKFFNRLHTKGKDGREKKLEKIGNQFSRRRKLSPHPGAVGKRGILRSNKR